MALYFKGGINRYTIDSNEYLLHLSVYINLNNTKVHQLGHSMSKSSWGEYISGDNNLFCNKSIILNQFNNMKIMKFLRMIFRINNAEKRNGRFLLE